MVLCKYTRFRLDYNQPITSMLEDSNLSYIFDEHDVDLTRNKITYTIIVV